MQLFETSTGLVPGTYPAAPARKPPSESSRKQEQQPNLQGSSGADVRSYVLDTSVESVTGAVIAGAAATYATSAGNTSDSDDTSFDLSTRRTPDGYVSEPNIKLSNGFIATYDSVISNAAKSPAKPDVYYSIRTGALKQQSTNFSSPSSGNGLVNSAASEYVAIERKDGLNVGLVAGAAVTAVGAGLSVLMRTQSDLPNPAPAKMRNFRAQFAKKKYSVEPSEVAAELGPQFFEGARVTANNAVATSVYLPTVTETVTTTTTTNEQGTETKTVVHLKPSYVAKTGSLSAIEASTQAIAVQKANFALDRARRFLYACQTSYGGKFDIRTFEIMSLFARPQFEVSAMFEFLLEFALTGEELTAGVISDSFYKASLELPARKQLHLLIALVGANESAVIKIFTDLLACLTEIQSVPVFLGALYPLSPVPSVPDSHIITVMELFLVRRVSLISDTARFDLTNFTAHVRRENRQMSPPFHISVVLKSIAQSIDPVFTPSAFRATLHACGVNSSSLAVFNGYLVTLCGSLDDATGVLALFARAVRLVGPSMFLRAMGESQQSVESFEVWE
ncbi:hypothetical protein HDU82_005920 [Entophlyctis luteolus]|nr:hypothetical protein HDU82_005920 [Entophlyctis luteolus]